MVEQGEQDRHDRHVGDDELERWADVARSRSSPPEEPHAWSELFEPLDPDASDKLVAAALARSRVAEPAASEEIGPPSSPRSRGSVGWAVAAVLAMAVALVLVLRPTVPGSSTPGLRIEMHGRAELRGAGAGIEPSEPVELHLRNETGWIVRSEAPIVERSLSLVAHVPGQPARLLQASIDARHGAFRVRGEVAALGLEPGDVTVSFVLGPPGEEERAIAVAEAVLAGTPAPAGYRVEARRLRIVE